MGAAKHLRQEILSVISEHGIKCRSTDFTNDLLSLMNDGYKIVPCADRLPDATLKLYYTSDGRLLFSQNKTWRYFKEGDVWGIIKNPEFWFESYSQAAIKELNKEK